VLTRVHARVLESQRITDTIENSFIGAFIPPKIARNFQRFAASMRQPLSTNANYRGT